MILSMTDGQARNLPAGDNVIVTGNLGYCSAVIVMWNPDGTGRFANVRGWHGNGGVAAIDFAALLAGVPHQPATRIFFVPGVSNRDTVLEAPFGEVARFQTQLPAQYQVCTITLSEPSISVSLDRTGSVTAANPGWVRIAVPA